MKHNLMTDLHAALSIKRPHGSVTEAAYVASLAKRLGPTMIDGAGNLHFDLRNGKSRTLFVAHTDTVSKGEGSNAILYDGDWWCSAPGSTLGADDGAGIALLLHLMRCKVTGYYIFCRCEEVGGAGSSYLAQEHEALLKQFDRAIAFDRKGVSSVITHQGGRCCSDEFGEALGETLSTNVLLYATDNTGVFTDTANFTDIIPECTNISCGYENEHSDKERLNVKHLRMLAAQIVQIDWEALPTKRDPKEDDWRYKWPGANEPYGPYGPYGPYDWKESALEMKEFTSDLLYALDLAKMGFFTELNDIVGKRYCSSVCIEKFNDADYYLNELSSGADAHEILDEIYWSVR